MGNHVIEYILKMTDATGHGLTSAWDRVRGFTTKVVSSMKKAKSSMDFKDVEEKFIHTANVLDKVGRAMDRLGVSGEEFNDVYDTLKTRLDNFNKTGEGFDDLLQHFRRSMLDVGATEQHVASGINMIKDNLIDVSKTGGAEALGKFSALRAVTAALNGNFGMLAQQLAKLCPAFQNAGTAGAAAVAAIGAAVMSVIKLVGALYDLFKVAFNIDGLPRDLSDASGYLHEMKESSKVFYDQMEEARKSSETLAKQFEDSARAINEMTKAQNEFNRAQELSKAKTDADKARINAKYDSLNGQADEKTAADILANQRKTAEEERTRLNEELKRAQEDQEKYIAESQRLHKNAKLYRTGVVGDYAEKIGAFFTQGGGVVGNERAMAALNASTNASNAYWDAVEKEDELKKKIAENDAKLSVIATKEKTAQLKTDTRKQQDANKSAGLSDGERKKQEREAAKREEELAQIGIEYERAVYEQSKDQASEALAYKVQLLEEYYAAMESCETQEQADELRREYALQSKRLAFVREVERERQKVEERVAQEAERQARRRQQQEQKMAEQDARERVRIAQQEQSDADSRLAAAKGYSAQAWGFYRDRDSLKAYNAEQDANMAAREQYAKDYKSLTHGVNADRFSHLKYLARHNGTGAVEEQLAEWRKKKTISLDTEAAMRVGVADDQERLAYKYAEETAKNTAQMAASLKEITEGGVE